MVTYIPKRLRAWIAPVVYVMLICTLSAFYHYVSIGRQATEH